MFCSKGEQQGGRCPLYQDLSSRGKVNFGCRMAMLDANLRPLLLESLGIPAWCSLALAVCRKAAWGACIHIHIATLQQTRIEDQMFYLPF